MIAREIMKIRRDWDVRFFVRVRAVIAIRLMWIPGIRPVMVPVRMPRRSGIRFSI